MSMDDYGPDFDDPWDDPDFDDYFYGDTPIRNPARITCKNCGEENLKWKMFGGRWTLVYPDTHRIHKCSKTILERFA